MVRYYIEPKVDRPSSLVADIWDAAVILLIFEPRSAAWLRTPKPLTVYFLREKKAEDLNRKLFGLIDEGEVS